MPSPSSPHLRFTLAQRNVKATLADGLIRLAVGATECKDHTPRCTPVQWEAFTNAYVVPHRLGALDPGDTRSNDAFAHIDDGLILRAFALGEEVMPLARRGRAKRAVRC